MAAPQIGINKRVIAVSLIHDRDEKEDENYRTIAMINPEITDHTEEMEYDNEGCLSIPGEHGDVDRWKRIKVSYIDSSLRPQSILLSGFAARIVQHEVDHLDGVLFTDRVKKIERFWRLINDNFFYKHSFTSHKDFNMRFRHNRK